MFPYISFEIKFLKIINEESSSVWDILSFNVDLVTKWTSGVWKQEREQRKGGIHLRFQTAEEPLGWTWTIRDAWETRKEPWEDVRDDMQTPPEWQEDWDKSGGRMGWYACGKTRTRWRQSGPSENRNTGKVKARHKDINHLPPSHSEKSEAPKL